MELKFEGMASDAAGRLRQGGSDAYGLLPERAVSDDDALPCRVCLGMIVGGEGYLIAAHRPFTLIGPYAETGPVFLHADRCDRAASHDGLPAMLDSPSYLLRGYGADQRIVYGTGGVVPRGDIEQKARNLLSRAEITFVDVRSAANNCWQCRICRA
jgi:hypothetical protein